MVRAKSCAWAAVCVFEWVDIYSVYMKYTYLHLLERLCTYFVLNRTFLLVYVFAYVRAVDPHIPVTSCHKLALMTTPRDWLDFLFVCWHLAGILFIWQEKRMVSQMCVCVCGRACPPLHTAGDICQFNSTRKGGDSCMWVSSVCLKKIMCEQGLLHFNESTLPFLPWQISFHLTWHTRSEIPDPPELVQQNIFMLKRSLTNCFHHIFC